MTRIISLSQKEPCRSYSCTSSEQGRLCSPRSVSDLCALRLDVDNLTIHHEEICSGVAGKPTAAGIHHVTARKSYTREYRQDNTMKMWRGQSNPLQLTLLEYDKDDGGHVITQVFVSSYVYSSRKQAHLKSGRSMGSFYYFRTLVALGAGC